MALIGSDHGRSTALVHGYDEDTQSVILIRAVLLEIQVPSAAARCCTESYKGVP